MREEEVLTWGKNGGVNVGEGETKFFPKRFFSHLEKTRRVPFLFPLRVFPHVFPPYFPPT
jgi:hypothetical protein